MTRIAPVTVAVGALMRRSFRVALDECGAEWTEHKGLLDSVFVVRGNAAQFRHLSRWASRVGVST